MRVAQLSALRTWAQRLVLPLVALGLAAFGGLEREFAPDAEPWSRWEAHAPASTLAVDHAPWQTLLDRYLEDRPGPNLFRYGAVTNADRAALAAYIDALAGVEVAALSRPAQFAYWVNLYNALTVGVILDHYPVDSIKDIDISPGLFSDGPWGAELVTVDGVALSLNDIEHRILRPIWADPRIHYAVNCAAIGCPDLQPDAFAADRLEPMLEVAARAFVNDPRAVRFEDGRLIVSSIYDWFHEDFGANDTDLLAHLKRYAAPDLMARLGAADAIAGARYDWALNAKR